LKRPFAASTHEARFAPPAAENIAEITAASKRIRPPDGRLRRAFGLKMVESECDAVAVG
jgi:hypothetical protein